MKAGDTVTVKDGSFSQTIVDSELKHTFPARPSIRGQHWTVVATECDLSSDPDSISQREGRYLNDTVIQGPDGVVFIHSGFLNLVPPPKPAHVWVHGDVFENHVDVTMIYLVIDKEPQLFCLTGACIGHNVNTYLKDATFLFNIKDALSDRGIL